MEILNERPEGMEFKEFKQRQNNQKRTRTKYLKRGTLVYSTHKMVNIAPDTEKPNMIRQRHLPSFEGNVNQDLIRKNK